MAQNGISTLSSKSDRKAAKMALAQTKRKAGGDTTKPYYRVLNVYTSPGTVSPTDGHPWTK